MEGTVARFDCHTQSLSALRAAAYRLIGTATCKIDQVGNEWVCHLALQGTRGRLPQQTDLVAHFLNLVTDENLRETIAPKVEPVRNLILALAFGALASAQDKSAG